ncbi:oligopeptide transport system ATP-binding protein [Micromonospora viridifaciens]|uniref:Oligopeptide transport system ATP-binding protein n=1 Tax=Micromonospora viridifaciens TaxID=1881 RepID=A0A1C4WS44_MICVI|nr:ATP-binding cassette domain-containing protein [Micromonospora viridifaciens]SCE99077.1 oligopeptide transport system ATP-binding protein [Micromonospora viridifaciens]
MTNQIPASVAPELLRVTELVKHFRAPRAAKRRGQSIVHALCSVSFSIGPAQTLGIVGESGSGKTTLLRTILGLQKPTAGRVLFLGNDASQLKGAAARALQRELSVVFQDPYTSLDPRMTVADILGEPAQIHGLAATSRRAVALLDQVRLPAASLRRFPHEFSGGQRQRIAIARALALDPKLVVLDEPVSALDVSVQAEILSLLKELQRERQISYLFVAHDLAVVADIAQRVGVMYGGQMVELGATGQVIAEPRHPYTRELLAAVPVPDPRIERAKPRMLQRHWPTETDNLPPCPHGDTL